MLIIKEVLEFLSNLLSVIRNYSSEFIACALLICGTVIGAKIEFDRINDEKLKPKKRKGYKFLVGLTASTIIAGAILQAQSSISSDKEANYYKSQVDERDSLLAAKTDTINQKAELIKQLSFGLKDSISAYHRVYTDIFNYEMCEGCFPLVLFRGNVFKMTLPRGYSSEVFAVYRVGFYLVNKGNYPMKDVVVSFQEHHALVERDSIKRVQLMSNGSMTPQINRGEYRKVEIGYVEPNYFDYNFYSIPLDIDLVNSGFGFSYSIRISWQSGMVDYTLQFKKIDGSSTGIKIVDMHVYSVNQQNLLKYYEDYKAYISLE